MDENLDGIIKEEGEVLPPPKLPTIITELSALRTRQDSIQEWVNQQRGEENYKKFIVPVILSLLLGLVSFMYMETKANLKELTDDFNEFKVEMTERVAKVEIQKK